MTSLREWSFARVVLVSVAWVILCVVALLLPLLLDIVRTMNGGSGSGGVAAVSVGFAEVDLLIPLLPPIALFGAWVIARRSRSAKVDRGH
jgi:hypothetical protein